MTTDFFELLQSPFFWRQLGIGIVVLIGLLILKSLYRKLTWTILLIIFGFLILLAYGQLYFATYGTEGERAAVEAQEATTWGNIQDFVSNWLGF